MRNLELIAIDGNGRTGRALIHVILRRRGLAPKVVPPISLVLATWSDDYVNGLMRTRYEGRPDSPEAVAAIKRQLASPDADTRSSPAARRVPY